MVGGKEALRRLFDSYHPPANLAADLRAVEVGILNALKARRVLNKKQWDLLFPDDDTELDSHNFDVTLLVTLLINICNLNPPSCGWLADPPPDNTSLGADITRIRILRNQCAHAVTTAIDTDSFFRKWQEVTDVLVRLGLSPDEVNDMHLDYDVEELVNTRDCFNKLKADIEIIVASIRQAQEEPQSLKGPQQAEQQSLVERLECVERKIDYLGISGNITTTINNMLAYYYFAICRQLYMVPSSGVCRQLYQWLQLNLICVVHVFNSNALWTLCYNNVRY